jgi:mannose-1-phosphate guanylyltransferase
MIIPVILSGGSGTRLWPMSRSERPKQLLPLTGTETMLQLTARRTMERPGFTSPIVVANAAHADEIESQLAAIGITDAAIVLEPAARNTAPAIALAALAAQPTDLLLVMPSDHVINDVQAFMAAVASVESLCAAGWLATFGITPDAPETGYGYICRGEEIAPGVNKVQRFVEKPDIDTAREYLASGHYSWNGGIFLFTAQSYLGALGRLEPDMLAAATEGMDKARRENGRIYPDAHAFGASPSESVDYAVMEKVDRVAVVPVDMGWSDLGSWDALHAIAPRDVHDNAHQGEVIAIDTAGCLLRTDGPLVAAVGVKDLIVIATGDAVLILKRGSSQDVKRAVEALKQEGHITLDRFTAVQAMLEG